MKHGEKPLSELRKLLPLLKRYKYILIVLLAGLILLLLPDGEREEEGVEVAGSGTVCFELEELEERMEKVLSQIEGAGEVSLILTVKGGVECIYAVDTEYSKGNDAYESSTTTVLISTGSGTEEAAVIQQVYPEFQGALVVCEGGDDPTVRLLITQAVAALTGLGTDRITVCK